MATIDELKKRIQELEEENARLREQQGGASGWLITTPSSAYSGQTMNVQFRRGCAFVPDSLDGERIARAMAAEFNYKIEHLDDFTALPDGNPVKKSMIDLLMIPQQMGQLGGM